MRILANILTLLLFMGAVILAYVGWPVEGDKFKAGEIHLYPAYYILLIYVFFAFLSNRMDRRKGRAALIIIALTFIWFLGGKVLGQTLSKMILFNSMALPAMYYIFYQSLYGERTRTNVKKILLFMFLLNSLWAIYERLTMTLWFPVDMIRSDFSFDRETDSAVFRSSALLGNPLTNALIMAIIMVFILTSKMNMFRKYFMYFIGLFGLFCFNARASIMISGGTLGLYMLYALFRKKSSVSQRLFAFIMLVVSVVVGIYLLKSGFGGRFEERGDITEDDSTMARIQVWDIFLKGDITDFLWGMSGDEAEKLAISAMGMIHIENWYILSSLVVGLVITTIVVLLFIPLFRNVLRPYDRFTSFLILIVVVGLSSTNNSLACGVPALPIFFACCYAFKNVKGRNRVNKTKECVEINE